MPLSNLKEPEAEATEEGFQCPECPKVLPTERGLNLHMQRMHGAEPAAKAKESNAKPRKKPFGEKDLNELSDRLHAHFTVIGMFVGAILPHTGLTIVSRTPDQHTVVKSADGVDHVIKRKGIVSACMSYAAKDERILQGLLAFDRFMSAGDEIQLVGSLASAVAVDTGLVDPEKGVGVPGTPFKFSPNMFIPDVIEALKQDEEPIDFANVRYSEHVREQSNHEATVDHDAEVIYGGVEAT